MLTAVAAASLAARIYLIFLHGGFWRADHRLPAATAMAPPGQWPAVIAVIPARNEAACIGAAVQSLLRQVYPGEFNIIVVDDASDDGTAAGARAAAAGAGAVGGCMLVRREALERAGGIAAIKDALIDDCALAAAIHQRGAVWLGLADHSASVRRYSRIGDVWRMVARTAYTQLRHSPPLLAATVLGMPLLYLAPPLALLVSPLAGAWAGGALGAAAVALMLIAYRPTWEHYRGDDPALVLLPFAALLYTAMTVGSAPSHARGRGGASKGRTYGARGRPRLKDGP